MKRVMASGEDDMHVEEPVGLPPVPPESPVEKGKPVFPPESMVPLNGLLFLGAISSSFDYAGHCFNIRTLTEGEVLRVGQLVKDYAGTLSQQEALRCYTVAACTVSVDSEPVSRPYKDGYDQIFENAKVVKRWFPPVVRKVYEEYLKLEATASAACKALKN